VSEEKRKRTLWTPVEAPTAQWAEKRRLAAAMRRVIEELCLTDASVKALRLATEGLEQFAGHLAEQPKRKGLAGYAESANAGDIHAFFDQSPLIGLSNPISPPLTLWTEGERVVGKGVFGTAFEGPPGCIHGGFVAAAFDEVLGFAQSLTGNPGMTGTLTVRYRRPTPLRTELRFDAGVDRVEGRKIFATGTITADGEVTAEAEGLFLSMDPERFGDLMDRYAAKDGGTSGTKDAG